MFEPIKQAFGVYLGGFYSAIVPSTKPLNEFIGRGLPLSIAWASTTMVDEAEKMLGAWQRKDFSENTANPTGKPTAPPKFPAILVTMARDYISTPREYTRQMSNPLETIIPGDTLDRVFHLQTINGDIRVQLYPNSV
jgi:hypothetical protein